MAKKEQPKADPRAARREAATEKRQQAKYEYLLNKNIDPKQAWKASHSRELSWDKIRDFEGKKVYVSRETLAALYVQITDGPSFANSLEQIRNWSNVQRKQYSEELYNHAGELFDRNRYGEGAVLIYRGPRDKVKRVIDKKVRRGKAVAAKQRKSGGQATKEYERYLAPTQEWTMDGFGNFLAACMETSKADDRANVYKELASYARDNLPEIYDFYFRGK